MFFKLITLLAIIGLSILLIPYFYSFKAFSVFELLLLLIGGGIFYSALIICLRLLVFGLAGIIAKAKYNDSFIKELEDRFINK